MKTKKKRNSIQRSNLIEWSKFNKMMSKYSNNKIKIIISFKKIKFGAKDNNIKKITWLSPLMMYHKLKKIYKKSLKMLALIKKKIFWACKVIIKFWILKDFLIFSYTI